MSGNNGCRKTVIILVFFAASAVTSGSDVCIFLITIHSTVNNIHDMKISGSKVGL